MDEYDVGLLNDWGGGNVAWWHDYLRYEIARANSHWIQQTESLRAELEEANDYINRMRDILTAAYPCIDQSRDACNCILCELVSRERQQAALAAKGE